MSTTTFRFSNGQTLRDKVTGVTGVVMVCALYATGCRHYGLLPRLPDANGEERKWQWIDESRLELVTEEPAIEFNRYESTSGPCPSGPNA